MKHLPPPLILVDTREQRMLPLHLCERSNPPRPVKMQRATLTAGDYSVAGFSHLFIAERKSLSDLTGTLTKGRERFENECDILAQFRWRWLLIEARQDEAEVGAYRSLMRTQSLMGSINALTWRWGIHVFWCGNPEGAAHQLSWAAYRLHQRHADLRQEAEKETGT